MKMKKKKRKEKKANNRIQDLILFIHLIILIEYKI
jgi:hypothetical protein